MIIDETTTPTPELAPCPCGKPAHIRPAPTPGYGGRYWGSCLSYMCQISGPICDSPTHAAHAWNALSLDVQRGKLAAKLAEALRQAWWILDGHQTKYCIVNAGILAEYDALTGTKEVSK